ncbi:MAG: CDP-diacylglycerol--serine O-phosphatidyltransferase [Calditrichia bacterium]
MKVRTNWVPNAFTMGNLFCGYFSVVMAANDKFVQASWLIVASAVLDALDGQVARLTNASSHFGVEYDSLADVVSFGFAPSFLAYKAVFINWGIVGVLIGFGPLVFGSIRLARFNVRLDGFDKKHFEGLPIPSAAVTIGSFVVFNYHFWGFLRWEKVFLFVVILVSVLMVTLIRFESLPNFTGPAAHKRSKILIILTCMALIIIFPQETFFPLAIIYVFSGPLRLIYHGLSRSESQNTINNKELQE